jgi:asparagine synthase (glutamine-hydrolysing)
MCGIFGIVSTHGTLREELLEKATLSIAHRGPDDYGYYKDRHALLGFRRLSIIDLEGGSQPIYNEDRSKCVIFNGEIYNYLDLRDELLKRGHRFLTRSDTETILHAYEEWREDCVSRFRGMFAFAIWDSVEKELFVARDRLGIKPVFFAEHAGKLYFASEMKAILADDTFPRELDEDALASYFSLSYIPAPMTIYRHIRKLLPGHTLSFRGDKITVRKYWDLYFAPDRSRNEKYFIDGFMDLLQEAVKIRLMSEVPLGAFLSGGVDSSTVVALMSMVSESPVRTFCIGFGGNVGGYLDERGFARQVSERYRTDHKEYEVIPNPAGLLDRVVRAFDEPFADDSAIPSFFVCKIARENVTVALSGLGGDEVFAGYQRYLGFRLSGLYKAFPSSIREHVFRRVVDRLPERADGHYTVNHMKRFVRSAGLNPDLRYFGYMHKMNPRAESALFSEPGRFRDGFRSCRDLVLSHFNSSNVSDDPDSLNRALYCDIKTYLPEDILAVTDRMSMHHSLEVRVPFLDHKFMEFCATIPAEMKMKWFRKKSLLKKAVADLLPREVLSHRKQGFVGPMAQWLKKDLKAFTLDVLSEKRIIKHGLLDHRTIRKVLEEHFSGREIHDTLIWSLLVFQKWFDLYMDGNNNSGH